MKIALLALAAVAAGAPANLANDWPQWRGPNFDGLSLETEWSPETGDELWSMDVGLGYSSVIVVGERLYTMGWSGPDGSKDGEDTVWCLDAELGEPIWTQKIAAKKWAKYHGGGSNCTPSYADGKLYITNRDGKFVCLDAESGDKLWEKDLLKADGLTVPTWGFACSPLIVDGQVIVNFGRVMAFTPKGKLIWKSGDLGHAYATPCPIEVDGKPCLASFSGSGFNLIDRKKGKVLGTHAWKTQYDVNASTPILVSKDQVFISSGYNHGCAVLEISTKKSPSVVWESKVMKTQMAGCVLYEDHLYGFDGKILKCIGVDGDEKWSQRGLGQGAHCLAGGHLIVLSDSGTMMIAEANPEGFDPIGEWEVLDGGQCWTPPVLVNGLIYCRNSKGQLVCRDHATATPRLP